MRDLVRFFYSSALYVAVHYLLVVFKIGVVEKFVCLPLILIFTFSPRSRILQFLSGFVGVYFARAATHVSWPVEIGWWKEAVFMGLAVGLAILIVRNLKGGWFVAPAVISIFYMFESYDILVVVLNYILTTSTLYVLKKKGGIE